MVVGQVVDVAVAVLKSQTYACKHARTPPQERAHKSDGLLQGEHRAVTLRERSARLEAVSSANVAIAIYINASGGFHRIDELLMTDSE